MKKQFLIFSSLCLLLTACENRGSRTDHTGRETKDRSSQATSSNQSDTQGGTENRDTRTDDTGRNVRDRSSQAVTPENQGENETDRTITQQIRRAIMEDNSLSFNAKNVKVITSNGVVVLRGVVNDEREKSEIERKVRGISGITNVQNELEIERSDESRAEDNTARSRQGNR